MLFDHLLKKTGYNSAQELYEAMSSSQPLRKLDKEDAKDPKSIRTKFDRWKKGTSPFTTKSFKNTYQHLLNINIEEYDESLLLIVFINIFSQKQRLLLEADVSPEAIAEAFSTYPRYRDKVNHNWEHFKLSLAPARVE